MTSEGEAYANMGKYEDAINCFDKALIINRSYADALINKGEALHDWKGRKKAMESFNQAKGCYELILKVNPRSVEALTNKGVAHYRLEEYDKAIYCYKEALNVNKNYAKAWFNKGLALYTLKKHHEAIVCFDICKDINPNYGKALIAKAWIYNDLTEYEKAIEIYDEALDLKTVSESVKSLAYFSRGEAKYGLGKYQSALKDFEQIAKDKYNGQKQVNMGLCNYQLGLYEQAEEKYLEAISFDPELAYGYYNLAVLYNSEKKRDKAKKMLQSCLNVDRNFSQARESIKRLEYSEQSDWYDWWFGGSRVKKLFGVGIILSIIALIVITAYISLGFENISIPGIANLTTGKLTTGNTQNVTDGNQPNEITGNVAALAALAGILVAMLLLPSLKTIKVAGMEMDSEFHVHKNVELEPAIAHLTKYVNPQSGLSRKI